MATIVAIVRFNSVIEVFVMAFSLRYYGWFLHLTDSQLLLKSAISSLTNVLPYIQVRFLCVDTAIFAYVFSRSFHSCNSLNSQEWPKCLPSTASELSSRFSHCIVVAIFVAKFFIIILKSASSPSIPTSLL